MPANLNANVVELVSYFTDAAGHHKQLKKERDSSKSMFFVV